MNGVVLAAASHTCSYSPPTYEQREDFDDRVYLGPNAPQDNEYLASLPWHRTEFGLAPVLNSAEDPWGDDYAANSGRGLMLHSKMTEPVRGFVSTLDYYSKWVAAQGVTGYGRVDWIGHMGGIRNEKGNPSYHYAEAALDVTHVHWSGGNISRPWRARSEVAVDGTSTPVEHRRLVAVEAALRKWFPYVLNRYIGSSRQPFGSARRRDPANPDKWLPAGDGPNSPHWNHFHVDLGYVPDPRNPEADYSGSCVSPALRVPLHETLDYHRRQYRSCAYFVQDCVNAFTDVQVPYDGRWGPVTEVGYKVLLSDLGMELLDPVRHLTVYQLLLNLVVMHGLAGERAGAFRWEGGASVVAVT